jgi:hypothetical protein
MVMTPWETAQWRLVGFCSFCAGSADKKPHNYYSLSPCVTCFQNSSLHTKGKDLMTSLWTKKNCRLLPTRTQCVTSCLWHIQIKSKLLSSHNFINQLTCLSPDRPPSDDSWGLHNWWQDTMTCTPTARQGLQNEQIYDSCYSWFYSNGRIQHREMVFSVWHMLTFYKKTS